MIEKRKQVRPVDEQPWTDTMPKHSCDCDEGCCPECGEEYQRPKVNRCICRKPLFISIPPGQHIHIQCPVHGDVKIYGPRLHWMSNPGTMYRSSLSC
jgi:hypothetical protein